MAEECLMEQWGGYLFLLTFLIGWVGGCWFVQWTLTWFLSTDNRVPDYLHERAERMTLRRKHREQRRRRKHI